MDLRRRAKSVKEERDAKRRRVDEEVHQDHLDDEVSHITMCL